MKINEKDKEKLFSIGWNETSPPANGYFCRICHSEIVLGIAWCSPKYSWYHSWCVEKSPSFKKALRQK